MGGTNAVWHKKHNNNQDKTKPSAANITAKLKQSYVYKRRKLYTIKHTSTIGILQKQHICQIMDMGNKRKGKKKKVERNRTIVFLSSFLSPSPCPADVLTVERNGGEEVVPGVKVK